MYSFGGVDFFHYIQSGGGALIQYFSIANIDLSMGLDNIQWTCEQRGYRARKSATHKCVRTVERFLILIIEDKRFGRFIIHPIDHREWHVAQHSRRPASIQ